MKTDGKKMQATACPSRLASAEAQTHHSWKRTCTCVICKMGTHAPGITLEQH